MRRKERDAKLVYHNPSISRCLPSQSVSCTLKWREAASLGEIATSVTKGLALCGRVAVDFAQCKSFAIRQEVSPIITLRRTGQRTNSETDHHRKTQPEATHQTPCMLEQSSAEHSLYQCRVTSQQTSRHVDRTSNTNQPIIQMWT